MRLLTRRSMAILAALAAVFFSISPAVATVGRGSYTYLPTTNSCCGNRHASNMYVYQVYNEADALNSQVDCVQEHVYPNWPSGTGNFFDSYKCNTGVAGHTLNGANIDQAYCWVNGGTVAMSCFENYNTYSSASRARQRAFPPGNSTLRAPSLKAAATAAAPGGPAAATVPEAMAPLRRMGKAYGADPARARLTVIGPGRARIWLVPGTGGACLVNVEMRQGAGSACNTAAAVSAGELWTLDTVPYGAGGAATQVLIGAAPAGTISATVSWTGGGTTVVPVTSHIYSLPIGAHSGWLAVTLTTRSGRTQTVAGLRHLPTATPGSGGAGTGVQPPSAWGNPIRPPAMRPGSAGGASASS